MCQECSLDHYPEESWVLDTFATSSDMGRASLGRRAPPAPQLLGQRELCGQRPSAAFKVLDLAVQAV